MLSEETGQKTIIKRSDQTKNQFDYKNILPLKDLFLQNHFILNGWWEGVVDESLYNLSERKHFLKVFEDFKRFRNSKTFLTSLR